MAGTKSKVIAPKKPARGRCSIKISVHVRKGSCEPDSPELDVRMSESPRVSKKMMAAPGPAANMVTMGTGPGDGGGGGGEPLVTIYIDINENN